MKLEEEEGAGGGSGTGGEELIEMVARVGAEAMALAG